MKKIYKLMTVGIVGGLVLLVGSGAGVFLVGDGVGVMAEGVGGVVSGVGVDGGLGNLDVESVELPELYFRAVNPGYVVDGVSNVGEMIEIARRGSLDERISLAGVTVRYTNTSGNETVLVKFPENSFLAGETILLRLASSPESGLANFTYKKTLAMNAKLELLRGDEVVDAVCWTGKDGCFAVFNKNNPTTLVRNMVSGDFGHLGDYEPIYNEGNYVLDEEGGSAEFNEKPGEDENDLEGGGEITGVDEGSGNEDSEEKPGEGVGGMVDNGKGVAKSQCKNLQFSEILSYYAEAQSEQFVEFYNDGAEHVLLDGCTLKYKNKLYPLSGIVKPEGYFVRLAEDFKLTKNPTSYNALEIIDTDGAVVDELLYPNGQKKGVAYAMVGHDKKGEEVWRATYAVTPGEPNIYQEYRTCEEGKVINEETGNCVKATLVAEKTCAVGYYLNPLTGRCKKIETEEEKVCREGYYLYEPTGRCRKVVENDGADYNLDVNRTSKEQKESTSFVAIYAVLGAVGLGIVYIIYEYRKEIVGFLKRIFRR